MSAAQCYMGFTPDESSAVVGVKIATRPSNEGGSFSHLAHAHRHCLSQVRLRHEVGAKKSAAKNQYEEKLYSKH